MRRRWPAVGPRVTAGVILLTAFFVRLLHVLSYEAAPTNDMAVYVDMAVRRLSLENLLTPEGLCWFPPGYALFLKPFFLLLDRPAALAAVKVAQAALGAWSCLLIMRLARHAGSRLAGIGAGVLAAFYPHFILYASAAMSETLFLALELAALALLMRAARRPGRRRRLYTAGLLAGAALLVRPVAVCLAPAALLASWRAGATRSARLRALALLLAGAATLVVPWTLRNRVAYGHWVVVAPNGAFNLAVGNHSRATGRYTTPPSINGDLWSRTEDFTVRALEFVVEDPRGALFVIMRLKWLAFWENIPPWPLYSSNPATFLGDHFFPFVSWRAVFALGLAGLGLAAARRRRDVWLLPACLACYVGVYLAFFGNARFRLPAEAFFLAWSGISVAFLLRWPRPLRPLRAGQWGTAACVLLALILAQSGLAGARTRAARHSPETLLASAEQFPVLPGRDPRPLFDGSLLPVERHRGPFLRLGMQFYRMGPPRDAPDNGHIRLEFLDAAGRPLRWYEHATFYLEALPADRWVPVVIRAHIPPRAASVRAVLVPSPEDPDIVIVDQPILRYSPGNEPAGEALFPYLRYRE